jgi:hypothetical protein
MKKIICLGLMFSSITYGQVSQGEIKNFNFDYQSPLGQGTAESFSYQSKFAMEQKVLVEKVGEDFKIKLEGVEEREIDFKNPPALIKDSESIHLSNFNLTLNQTATLSMAKANFSSPDKDLDLSSFTLNCNRFAGHTALMDQMIVGCLEKMVIKAGGFNSRAEEGIEQALNKALDTGFDAKQSVGIKNMNLKITAGKFDLSAEIKAQISGKATGNGSIRYDQPTKKLTVKLSQLKFGILDVTSRVFDELEKLENANIQVNQPYIYFTLK